MAYDEDLANRLREALAHEAGVSEKKMFGGLAFLVGGKMAVCAASRGSLMVRQDREADVPDEPHVEAMEMRGRPMRGWLLVAPEGVTDDAALRRWTSLGVATARAQP